MSAASSSSASGAPQPEPGFSMLYVGNLAFDVTSADLQAWLQERTQGEVKDVTVIMRKGKDGPRSRGIAFAKVATEKLDTALALKGQQFRGRQFDVQLAKAQSKAAEGSSASNVSGSAEASQKKGRSRRRRSGSKPSSGAAVNAAGADASSASASSDGAPRSSSRALGLSPEHASTHSLLYINNLPFDAEESDVVSMLREAAQVEPLQLQLVTSQFGKFVGRSRGFGFAAVRNEEVSRALALHGTEWRGRTVGVACANGKVLEASASSEAAPSKQ